MAQSIEWGGTPGPWRVVCYDAGDTPHYDHNGPCPLIAAPDEEDCAVVHWDGFKQRYWSSANGNQRQIEANARAIAKVPEMVAALRYFRPVLANHIGQEVSASELADLDRLLAEIEGSA